MFYISLCSMVVNIIYTYKIIFLCISIYIHLYLLYPYENLSINLLRKIFITLVLYYSFDEMNNEKVNRFNN